MSAVAQNRRVLTFVVEHLGGTPHSGYARHRFLPISEPRFFNCMKTFQPVLLG